MTMYRWLTHAAPAHHDRRSRCSPTEHHGFEQGHELNAAARLNPSAARLRFDRFELDESEARLTRAGEPVTLAPRPFGVLCALARNPGHLVTKDALLDFVWGHRFVSESALKMAISVLRAALDDDPKQPRYIETVSRRGYRFIAAATRSPTQGAAGSDQKDAGTPGQPGFAELAAMCRRDAALADLIRALAATLAQERLVLD